MSDREEFLADWVISITSDDYESFELIFEQVCRLAELKGITVSETEAAKALERAIADGFMEAYVLSPHEPQSLKIKFSLEQLHELWFYVTPIGRTLAKSIPELSGEDY